MTRPEEIAAALEMWTRYRLDSPHRRTDTGDEMARLLRAANPPINSESSTEPADAEQIRRDRGRTFISEPATPAVGEDAGADCECTCASELAEKVRALLADVARLQKELDGTTFREERYAEDAAGARLALEDARAERDKALATLAAVRKIADDYHDVDVRGTPPREVACNPCANDILNVLEGRKP